LEQHCLTTIKKMAGQKYRRFKYSGKVFTVNQSEETFINSQASGKLNEVNLEIDAEGRLGFVDCLTQEQYNNFRLGQVEDAKTEGMINYYKTTKFVPTKVNTLEELPA